MNFTSDTMQLHINNGIGYLTYNVLSDIPFIHHAFSTKIGESSRSAHNMDLSFDHGEKDLITENYHLFCDAAGFDYDTLVASSQDHHTFVRVCTEKEKGIGIYREKDIESVDGLVTNVKGVTLVTYYADCTPLFFVDTKRKAIGLAHGGWRGTVAGIAATVVETMQENYGADPADLICCIGPNIGKCCYEVDEPVAQQFYALSKAPFGKGSCQRELTEGLYNQQTDFHISPFDFVFPKNDGKYMINLKEANRQILISVGVKPENITLSDLCTQCQSDYLWSHRATKGDRGTMSAFMCLE